MKNYRTARFYICDIDSTQRLQRQGQRSYAVSCPTANKPTLLSRARLSKMWETNDERELGPHPVNPRPTGRRKARFTSQRNLGRVAYDQIERLALCIWCQPVWLSHSCWWRIANWCIYKDSYHFWGHFCPWVPLYTLGEGGKGLTPFGITYSTKSITERNHWEESVKVWALYELSRVLSIYLPLWSIAIT